MKRCPTCRRDYYDDSLLYCLDDGTALLEGPATAEPKTETLPQIDVPSEAPTRHQAVATAEIATGEVSNPSIAGILKSHKAAAVAALLVGIVVLAGFGYGLYRLARDRGEAPTQRAAADIKVQAMTASGKVREASISPDGRFLAYTEESGGQTAAFTKQISTNSNVQISPPTKYDFFALKFSSDGEYVYYGLYEGGSGTIYRVPTLGGPPVKVIENVDGQLAFSPDGQQFAVERYEMGPGESAIIIVNADGSGARKLVSRTGDQYFSASSIAWSPDGKFLAVGAADQAQSRAFAMASINVGTGEYRELGKERFDEISNSAWRKDQSGLFFVASDKGSNVPKQIWEMSYPSGEAHQITRDLSGYVQLSMTADGKNLVSVQRDSFSAVWYSQTNDLNKAEQITRGKKEGGNGMCLAPDGRPIYVSNVSGAIEIWISNPDGSGARQITNDGISKYTPAVTPDGRFIFFISEKAGRHLWRIDMDGGRPMQMGTLSEDGNPRTSPDGKWVVFDSYRSGALALWRISVEGGDAQQLTNYPAMEPDISPDGKSIAAFTADESTGKRLRLIVLPFDGGPPVKTFDIPQTTFIDGSPLWTPDGKGITYIDRLGDVSNMWVQPLDGSPAKQMTNNKQGYIYRREWTRDGKRVAIVRGTETSDAVMITGF